jgi:mRNA-degrading endonuclease RelE of RelBE toxin-antitoxin system
MSKPVKIVFSPEAQQIYNNLSEKANNSKQERTLLNAINNKLSIVQYNYHYGNPIAKKIIPKEYIIKYKTSNLFRVELPCFWRMLYTLTSKEQIEIIAFVLDVLNHNEYNKKFGYEKR